MKPYIELKKMAEIVLVNDCAAAVATLVMHNQRLLLGKRFKGQPLQEKQFEGWQCPGGYLQRGETIEQAASRHCLQKAGIEIASLRSGPYSNNIFSKYLHTVTLYIIAEEHHIQNHQVFENKQIQWHWFALDELPVPLFLPLNNLVKQYNLSHLL